jgi:hypothetical protein
LENHDCYSKAEGVCCNGRWNAGFDSCSLDFSKAEELLEQVGDDYAVALIDAAHASVSSGELQKAEAELSVAVAKLEIESASGFGFDTKNANEVFLAAKTALESGDFETAALKAGNSVEAINPAQPVGILTLVLTGGSALLALIVLAILLGKSRTRKPEDKRIALMQELKERSSEKRNLSKNEKIEKIKEELRKIGEK